MFGVGCGGVLVYRVMASIFVFRVVAVVFRVVNAAAFIGGLDGLPGLALVTVSVLMAVQVSAMVCRLSLIIFSMLSLSVPMCSFCALAS